MNVYVTRHGARIDNSPVDSDSSWMRKAGHRRRDDPHLSPSGEAAAVELARRLKSTKGDEPAVIVTSPFVRCVQTADAVAAALDLKIVVENGICEVLSTFPPGLLSLEELAARFPRIDTTYSPVVTRDELRVEYSDGQAAARARSATLAVCDKLGGNLLFVGHGASCLGIVAAFGGSGYIGYTTLSHFRREKDGESWRLVGELGDASHLTDQRTALGSAW